MFVSLYYLVYLFIMNICMKILFSVTTGGLNTTADVLYFDLTVERKQVLKQPALCVKGANVFVF